MRLDSAHAKAEAVMGQADLSERGKAQEVEKLYARARAGRGAKKAKPTRAQREHGKQKGPRLDARMRADQRQARCVARDVNHVFVGGVLGSCTHGRCTDNEHQIERQA